MLSYVGDVNGNRLLLLDLRGKPHVGCADLAEVSEKLCSTGFIDDLLVIEDSDRACAALRVIGADRREADFCGDGFLFVLFVLSEQMSLAGRQEERLAIETRHGIKYGERSEAGCVSAMIGAVEIRDDEVTEVAREVIDVFGAKFEGYRVAGEPHLVVSAPIGSALQKYDQEEFELLARKLAPLIPHEGGVNVTMIVSSAPQFAKIRTFERGVQRMTLACGSGAVATASILFELDRSKTAFQIESPGGLHCVSTDPQGKDWRLAVEEINIDAERDFELDAFEPERDSQRLLQFIRA